MIEFLKLAKSESFFIRIKVKRATETDDVSDLLLKARWNKNNPKLFLNELYFNIMK